MAQRFSWAFPEALDEAEGVVELLGAPGFLPHSLLKPILNPRTDSCRARLGIRMRYPSKWPPRSARSGRATRRSACVLPAR